MKNYYEILGVPPTIPSHGLKTRFRQMMLEFHPDVSLDPNSEERYGEIMEAYRTLIDVNMRMAYDFSNGFPGPEDPSRRRYAKQEASASRRDPEMTPEERKARLERLLAEKREKEENRGIFSVSRYFGRVKLWAVFIALVIIIPAISIVLEFFHYVNTSNRKLEVSKAGIISAGVTLVILVAFLILRAITLSFRYRPPKGALWGLSFICASAYAYANFFLGEKFSYKSYFSSTLIDGDSIVGIVIFTLLFAIGLFSVENKRMFGK
ncbi:hypothetical protein FACS1894204_07180 [Synergistales bacterium]|nr:hypothetical protein FACS1894204_07180 [Synergistales bacterium]